MVTQEAGVLERAVGRFRDAGIALPRFAELADPSLVPESIRARLASVGPDDPDPLNLFRVNWFNDAARTGIVDVPEHVVLPRELTGVEAPIVVALGDRFPMIGAHKVLAAYGCLAPRVVSRRIRPDRGSRRLAVDRQLLPRRRRDLAPDGLPRRRGAARGDEPGALRLARALGRATRTTSSAPPAPRATSRRSTTAARSSRPTRDNVIFNQFAEFGNYVVALLRDRPRRSSASSSRCWRERPSLRLRAFVSATGSAGTIGGRRLPEGAATARGSSRSRRSSARRCSRTASASTTSRGSATSTSRSSTTS